MRFKAQLVAGLVFGAWLGFLASRQTALYPTVARPATELMPTLLTLGVIVVAIVGRRLAPSTSVAVVCMAILSCGAALLGAQLGSPLANASGDVVGSDYCGDLCRTAIMARFLGFFGWPFLAAAGLVLLGRADRVMPGGLERLAWTRAWASATLVLGLVGSVIWWRIILPNG